MRVSLCVCACVMLLAGPVAAGPIYHAGSTDPLTEGWYVMSGVAGTDR